MEVELVDITQEIHNATKRLEEGSKEIYKLAQEKADTERAYRIALRQEILRLKTEGQSITLISDLARGADDVATKKLARDLADARWYSARDSLRSISDQLSGLQSILKIQKEV